MTKFDYLFFMRQHQLPLLWGCVALILAVFWLGWRDAILLSLRLRGAMLREALINFLIDYGLGILLALLLICYWFLIFDRPR